MQVYQSSNLTIQSVVAMLGIDYDDEDKAYVWALAPHDIERAKDADLSPSPMGPCAYAHIVQEKEDILLT